ncbi:MAG: hypothetical protein JWQ35_1426 [Bacteriovoracaceae bacterium]|nr:hypothetical protein [Bacteriovoracaceae bacterium]
MATIVIFTNIIFAVYAEEKLETHTSVSGAVFVRDQSEPNLKEAYRDSGGLIWGDLVSASDGTSVMTKDESIEYCRSKDARLPTEEELSQLLADLSLKANDGGFSPYVPGTKTQVLPHLYKNAFWSQDGNVYQYDDIARVVFVNSFMPIPGVVGPSKYSVRCVSDKKLEFSRLIKMKAQIIADAELIKNLGVDKMNQSSPGMNELAITEVNSTSTVNETTRSAPRELRRGEMQFTYSGTVYDGPILTQGYYTVIVKITDGAGIINSPNFQPKFIAEFEDLIIYK